MAKSKETRWGLSLKTESFSIIHVWGKSSQVVSSSQGITSSCSLLEFPLLVSIVSSRLHCLYFKLVIVLKYSLQPQKAAVWIIKVDCSKVACVWCNYCARVKWGCKDQQTNRQTQKSKATLGPAAAACFVCGQLIKQHGHVWVWLWNVSGRSLVGHFSGAKFKWT